MCCVVETGNVKGAKQLSCMQMMKTPLCNFQMKPVDCCKATRILIFFLEYMNITGRKRAFSIFNQIDMRVNFPPFEGSSELITRTLQGKMMHRPAMTNKY